MSKTHVELLDEETRVLAAISDVTWSTAADISDRAGIARSDGAVAANVRAVITRLIFQETPIISSSQGYKIATTKSEVLTYIESLHGRSRGLAERISALQRAAMTLGERDNG